MSRRDHYDYLQGVSTIPDDAHHTLKHSDALDAEQEARADAAIAEATWQIHRMKEAERVKHWSRSEFELREFSTSKPPRGGLLMRSA